jgi:hypothetical protein
VGRGTRYNRGFRAYDKERIMDIETMFAKTIQGSPEIKAAFEKKLLAAIEGVDDKWIDEQVKGLMEGFIDYLAEEEDFMDAMAKPVLAAISRRMADVVKNI